MLLVGDANLESAGEHVKRLLLAVMDVQGRAAVGGDIDEEVVEGATGVVAGELEDKIAARPGLESAPLVGREELGSEHGWHFCLLGIVAGRK